MGCAKCMVNVTIHCSLFIVLGGNNNRLSHQQHVKARSQVNNRNSSPQQLGSIVVITNQQLQQPIVNQ
jgi:hypothetical protein